VRVGPSPTPFFAGGAPNDPVLVEGLDDREVSRDENVRSSHAAEKRVLRRPPTDARKGVQSTQGFVQPKRAPCSPVKSTRGLLTSKPDESPRFDAAESDATEAFGPQRGHSRWGRNVRNFDAFDIDMSPGRGEQTFANRVGRTDR
jgi:hypothetical protein